MTTTPVRLRSPEVARRLGINGEEVYRLIFTGQLDGRPDADGVVYVTEASVDTYLEAQAQGEPEQQAQGS